MPNPVQRSACDRCHGQKLRCTRTSSGGACARCTRVRAACTWTPSTTRRNEFLKADILRHEDSSVVIPETGPGQDGSSRTGAASRTGTTPETLPALAELDFGGLGPCPFQDTSMAASWSGPTFVDPISTLRPSTACTASGATTFSSCMQSQSGDPINTWQSRFDQEWSMWSLENQKLADDPNEPTVQRSPVSDLQGRRNLPMATIRGLSDLNVELAALSSVIPKPPARSSAPLVWKNKEFSIEQTFHLSHRFIQVTDGLYPRSDKPASIPKENPISSVPLNPSPPLDQPSFLLVIACYQRLITIYGDIFGNMQACLDRFASTAPSDYVQMPDMKVGSFSLPPSSALQITMVLQLARHLLRRMRSIIKSLDEDILCGRADADNIMSLMFTAVDTKDNELIEGINKLRNSLQSLDIL